MSQSQQFHGFPAFGLGAPVTVRQENDPMLAGMFAAVARQRAFDQALAAAKKEMPKNIQAWHDLSEEQRGAFVPNLLNCQAMLFLSEHDPKTAVSEHKRILDGLSDADKVKYLPTLVNSPAYVLALKDETYPTGALVNLCHSAELGLGGDVLEQAIPLLLDNAVTRAYPDRIQSLGMVGYYYDLLDKLADRAAVERQLPQFATYPAWDEWRARDGDAGVCASILRWMSNFSNWALSHENYTLGEKMSRQLENTLKTGEELPEARRRMGEFFDELLVKLRGEGYSPLLVTLAQIGKDIALDQHQTHAPGAAQAVEAVQKLVDQPTGDAPAPGNM